MPVHRFAFQEVQQLLAMSNPTALAAPGKSPLVELGTDSVSHRRSVVKMFPTTATPASKSCAASACIPETDLIEAVLTVKKSSGYSGGLVRQRLARVRRVLDRLQ